MLDAVVEFGEKLLHGGHLGLVFHFAIHTVHLFLFPPAGGEEVFLSVRR